MNLEFYAGIGLALLVAALIILPSWRRGVHILFGWLLLEDIVRRIVPGQPIEIQAIKEGILFLTYVSFFVTRRMEGKQLWMPAFIPSLVAFSFVVFMQSLNPAISGLVVPLLGIRSYLWYVPLVWIGYYVFSRKEDFARFARRLTYVAIPLGAVGIIQYIFWEQLPEWLQPLEGAHTFHSAAWEYRGEQIGYESKLPSSVFGAAHRFAIFSLFLFFLGIGLWGWKGQAKKFRRWLTRGFPILASLVCIVVAGTRMGMLLALVGILLMTIAPVLTQQKGFLGRRARLRKVLAGTILAAAFLGLLQAFTVPGEFFVRSTESDLMAHVKELTGRDLPFALKRASWLGFGTGTLSQGVTHFVTGKEVLEAPSEHVKEIGVEYGLAKVIWELGIAGVIMYLIWWGHMFRSLWRNLRAIQDPATKGLARALGIFLVLVFVASMKSHQYFGDGTTLAVYWFAMGLFFSLFRLERLEAAQLHMSGGLPTRVLRTEPAPVGAS